MSTLEITSIIVGYWLMIPYTGYVIGRLWWQEIEDDGQIVPLVIVACLWPATLPIMAVVAAIYKGNGQ